MSAFIKQWFAAAVTAVKAEYSRNFALRVTWHVGVFYVAAWAAAAIFIDARTAAYLAPAAVLFTAIGIGLRPRATADGKKLIEFIDQVMGNGRVDKERLEHLETENQTLQSKLAWAHNKLHEKDRILEKLNGPQAPKKKEVKAPWVRRPANVDHRPAVAMEQYA